MALCTGVLEWLRGFSSHPYIKINHGYGICKEIGVKLKHRDSFGKENKTCYIFDKTLNHSISKQLSRFEPKLD